MYVHIIQSLNITPLGPRLVLMYELLVIDIYTFLYILKLWRLKGIFVRSKSRHCNYGHKNAFIFRGASRTNDTEHLSRRRAQPPARGSVLTGLWKYSKIRNFSSRYKYK